MSSASTGRGNWASGLGFVMAAAGSAVGLGNLWRFPYVTGANGGGLFVLIYLACILLVGLPVLLAEIVLGRATQTSPVGAMRKLAGKGSPWIGLGWMGVVAAYLILSFYAVVAGWTLHYTWLSATGALRGIPNEAIAATFGKVHGDAGINLLWTTVFMGLTMAVVAGGVQKGLERWTRILMPALFLMLLALSAFGMRLSGFGDAMSFVFGFHVSDIHASGVLAALGQAFFTLGVGMGVMLTYGSYLPKEANIVTDAAWVTGLDTAVALLACLAIFPVTFTFGLDPAGGPGLVFQNIPVAFAQLPVGQVFAVIFFLLLVFAALTSSISILEVVTAYFIDERQWSRAKATWVGGIAIAVLAIPSALSGGANPFAHFFGEKSWFDVADFTVSNVMLPLGGLLFAVFVSWRITEVVRRDQFPDNVAGAIYHGWLNVLRYFVPLCVALVLLNSLGLLKYVGL